MYFILLVLEAASLGFIIIGGCALFKYIKKVMK